jgi:hypothetical protein
MMLMLLLCDMHDEEDGLCIETNKENSSVVSHKYFPLLTSEDDTDNQDEIEHILRRWDTL